MRTGLPSRACLVFFAFVGISTSSLCILDRSWHRGVQEPRANSNDLYQTAVAFEETFGGMRRGGGDLFLLQGLAALNLTFRCDIKDRNYDVLLVSPGGTGSTSGFDFISQTFGIPYESMNNQHDADFLKHVKYPSLREKMLLCNLKAKVIIYQFSDPTYALISLFRRGFVNSHLSKLEPSYSATQCTEGIGKQISTYATVREDLLGLEPHWRSYVVGSYDHPIIFLRSDTRNMDKVRVALGHLLVTLNVTTPDRIHFSTSAVNIFANKRGPQNYTVGNPIDENSETYRAINDTYIVFKNELNKLGFLSFAFRGEVKTLPDNTYHRRYLQR